MTYARRARVVTHGNLGDVVAFNLDERGHEAVHAFEKFQVGYALAAEHPVAARGIGHGLVRHPVADAVGNLGGQLADDGIALRAVGLAIAADAVGIFNGLQKLRQVGGVVL